MIEMRYQNLHLSDICFNAKQRIEKRLGVIIIDTWHEIDYSYFLNKENTHKLSLQPHQSL
jgi:hypothetical protein